MCFTGLCQKVNGTECQWKFRPPWSETQQFVCWLPHCLLLHKTDYLILSERPLCGLRSLRSALRGKESERERELRDGEREGGKDGWWTRGRPCGHHHQAAPDSSYHAWAALWRAAVGRGGLRMRNSRGEKRARSAELIVLWRGTLTTGVITVEQAMGHCSSPRRPTDSYTTAASCRPHCRVLPPITGCCGPYCNHSSNIWRQ